jgi:hypothetical protein
MAKRSPKLKVFKTPIGFHDAYVAAPSRKSALEAWGAGTDLFTAGIAELVTGSGEGAKAALAKPGEVVRVGREGNEANSPSTSPGRTGRKMAKAKAKPRPSQAALEKAEAALAELETAQAAERALLAREEEKLDKRRRGMEDKQRKARERAEAKRDEAWTRYRQAMAEWVG